MGGLASCGFFFISEEGGYGWAGGVRVRFSAFLRGLGFRPISPIAYPGAFGIGGDNSQYSKETVPGPKTNPPGLLKHAGSRFGQALVGLWSSYGQAMVGLWSSCGQAMAKLWSSFDQALVGLWSSMAKLWSRRGQAKVNPCLPAVARMQQLLQGPSPELERVVLAGTARLLLWPLEALRRGRSAAAAATLSVSVAGHRTNNKRPPGRIAVFMIAMYYACMCIMHYACIVGI